VRRAQVDFDEAPVTFQRRASYVTGSAASPRMPLMMPFAAGTRVGALG
jgi:hypothetical protein